MAKNLPALAKLTDMQARYVVAFVENGGDGAAAARAAGYASDRQQSWALQQSPAVQEAIWQVQQREFAGLASNSIKLLRLIIARGIREIEAGQPVRQVFVDAAAKALDRAGHVAKTKLKQEDGEKRLEDMSADELRTYIDKARGRLADEIDGSAVDVTPESGDNAPDGAQRGD